MHNPGALSQTPQPHPQTVPEYHLLDTVPRVEAVLMEKCPSAALAVEARETQNGLLHHQPSDYCFSRSRRDRQAACCRLPRPIIFALDGCRETKDEPDDPSPHPLERHG
jgi:hypothetical protein